MTSILKSIGLQFSYSNYATPCKHYQKGYCKLGESCKFKHEGIQKRKLCRHFLNGYCERGDDCGFRHGLFEDELKFSKSQENSQEEDESSQEESFESSQEEDENSQKESFEEESSQEEEESSQEEDESSQDDISGGDVIDSSNIIEHPKESSQDENINISRGDIIDANDNIEETYHWFNVPTNMIMFFAQTENDTQENIWIQIPKDYIPIYYIPTQIQ